MKVTHVIGARPNFMKAGPVLTALARDSTVEQVVVHTGQHYDKNMSDVFFRQLELPKPDINLEVGSGSHAQQTAEVMVRFERAVKRIEPDWVVVYGDVNSTVAASLVCAKLGIAIAHVEAGLRSFDRTMPEEINRILTDQMADLLFTPSSDGDENLAREGIHPSKIHLVGNVMIDTLVRLLPRAISSWPSLQQHLKLPSSFGLVTLHRPSNVDTPTALREIMHTLTAIAQELPLVLPVHPRTRQRLVDWDLATTGLELIEPQGYLEFLALQKHAVVVITDSGGIQEETTYLGTPCLTLRENTERPITVATGTNRLVGRDMARLRLEVRKIQERDRPHPRTIPLWDGRAAERIASVLK